jgi:magnesium transporter
MKIFDFSKHHYYETEKLTMDDIDKELFIICHPVDVYNLTDLFGFHVSTVRDCNDLDESVRFSIFEGYDFISLVHIEMGDANVIQNEINIYVSYSMMIVVFPFTNSERIAHIEQKIMDTALRYSDSNVKQYISEILNALMNEFITDYFDLLETVESEMELLLETMVKDINSSDFVGIYFKRKIIYTTKKVLRAFTHTFDQMQLNENKVFTNEMKAEIENTNVRVRKLYDFAVDVFDLSMQLLNTYDSKVTMKTNDIINRLTIITLFFSPLTVITGIYGMNFDFMPELHWRYGYLFSAVIMVISIILMYWYMKKKKWLPEQKKRR